MGFLDGKVAIVSGAAQGLGEAFAGALASNGADLCLFDVDARVLEVGRQLEQAHGVRVLAQVADVAVRADVERVVAAAGALGGVDILVNNAGVWRRTEVTDPWEKALADFDEVMDANLKGPLMLGRLCIPKMIERGGGDIVNISTYYVLPARSEGTNPPGTDCYNASKWGLNGFTGPWALALANRNIRVNAICPGATDTAMLRGLWPDGNPPEEIRKTWMTPEQIAALLIDLLKDGRTGENIGAWVGHPVELGPRQRPDSTLRMRPEFTGQPMRLWGEPPWDDVLEPVPVNMAGPRA